MGDSSYKLGKQFEKDLQGILNLLKTTHHLYYVRLYDTTSARGKFLPDQPGDFIVSARSRGHLIECKASDKHTSLRGCLSGMVSTQQAAAHQLWVRSGNPAWFLFLDHRNQQLEVWDGGLVGKHRAEGTVLPQAGYEVCAPYSLFKESMIELFNI